MSGPSRRDESTCPRASADTRANHLAEPTLFAHAGTCPQHTDRALFLLDSLEQTVQIVEVGRPVCTSRPSILRSDNARIADRSTSCSVPAGDSDSDAYASLFVRRGHPFVRRLISDSLAGRSDPSRDKRPAQLLDVHARDGPADDEPLDLTRPLEDGEDLRRQCILPVQSGVRRTNSGVGAMNAH